MLTRRKTSIVVIVIGASAVAACVGVAVADVPADVSSPWGVSPSAALSNVPGEWIQVMADAGVTSVRGYDYRRGESGLAPFREAGLAVSGILAWNPGPKRHLPLDDMPGFEAYVRRTITTFGGYIKHWELWNEPPNTTGDRSGAAYGRVVGVAYDAAKRVDPTIQIGLAAKSVHIRYLAEAITGGAKGKFDFIALHPYETGALLSQGWELPFLGIASNIRAMLRELDPLKANVPIWFTEIGVETDRSGSRDSEQRQADMLVKIYTLSLAQGISHIHWFDPRDSEGRRLGLLRHDGSRRPAYTALAQLSHALGKVPRFKGFLTLAPNTYGFLFAGEQADTVIVWSQPGKSADLALHSSVSVVRPATAARRETQMITVQEEPMLLTARHGSMPSERWLHDATPSVPDAWSCAVQQRRAVYVPGQSDCGLHLVAGHLAKEQPRPSELSLAGTSGVAFAVDPQYIGYPDQAIEVTAVVRGHGRRGSGFNLKYEVERPLTAVNDNGMAGTPGWNRVEGDQPTALHWSVKDARFVGKYGINLVLDCNSHKYCDFSLLSLTIRKN